MVSETSSRRDIKAQKHKTGRPWAACFFEPGHVTYTMKHVAYMKKEETFHGRLKQLIHRYILLTYRSTKKYPKDEKYGLTSQDRRAAVSVMLNYVEGYARMRPAVMLNFYETSYASLKESIYCRFLAMNLQYINLKEYHESYTLKEEIGAMLYSTLTGLRKKLDK